jgi:hypothetical protein
MPSPFPGMDPYLESPAIWPDFHSQFIAAIKADLNSRLPSRYAARADRYVWIHEPDANERRLLGKPDVYVADPANGGNGPARPSTLVAPATVVLSAVRREGQRYVKIIDLRAHRVVTVIEVLSPTNKAAGEDRENYLVKRSEYLGSRINLVEIDLLRSGERMPWGDPSPPTANYYVLISRVEEFPTAGVWPLSIRESLPEIPIPLSPPDEEAQLFLQKCFDRAYDEGRYQLEIDYSQPPSPPLTESDATWSRELLSRRIP